MGAADQLDVNGKPFGRAAKGESNAGKADEIQPLAKTHGLAIIVRIAGAIIARAMSESGSRGNGREKNGDVAELTQQVGAKQVTLGAGRA